MFHNWGFSWPRTGASCTTAPPRTPKGRPGIPSARNRLERREMGGRRPRHQTRLEAGRVRPSSCCPKGSGALFPALNDGPFPEHYEAIEAPIDNPLHPKVTSNPASKKFSTDKDVYGKKEDFPIVCTTYRLTEHFHYWTQHQQNGRLNEMQPGFFIEIPEGLAEQKGIRNGSQVKVLSARGRSGRRDGHQTNAGAENRRQAAWQIGSRSTGGSPAPPTTPARSRTPHSVGNGREHVDAGIQGVPRESGKGVGGGHEHAEPRNPPLFRFGLGRQDRPADRPDGLQVHRHHHLHRLQGLRSRVPGWNDLGTVATQQTGTYQTLPTLHAQYWNLIRFSERDFDGGIAWLMRKDQCMHCEGPAVSRRARRPARSSSTPMASWTSTPTSASAAGTANPVARSTFPVSRDHRKDGQVHALRGPDLVGLEPACIKACPTGCLQFGPRTTCSCSASCASSS